jgi:hypothetical protein
MSTAECKQVGISTSNWEQTQTKPDQQEQAAANLTTTTAMAWT